MDVATRFQPRVRAGTHLEQQQQQQRNNNVGGGGAAAVPDDSGTESESLGRRKFQRTTGADSGSNDTFRKPTIPASASKLQADPKSSFTHRRRSTLRENVRVPSGPREYPGSPGKRVFSGSNSSVTSITGSNNSSRTFLPQATSEPYFSKNADASRYSFDRPSSNRSHENTTMLNSRPGNDFMPELNFDDLQTSIANYDGNEPLLSEFPAVGAGRTLPREASSSSLSRNAAASNTPRMQAREETGLRREGSLRRRLSAVAGGKSATGQPANREPAVGMLQPEVLSLRTRRQSTAPQGPPPAGPAPAPAGAAPRQPRKSLGPGVIASMVEGRKASQPLPTSATESNLRSNLIRSGSLSKTSRRTTMQPAASGGAELPRALTATTQSRANKVKSLQPPPRQFREHDPYPDTPPVRPMSKGNPNRSHTPSSSGKRQSTASGRASGLGARTISPTDARRLKRLSMMQAPPLPSHPPKELPPPPPPDEYRMSRPELPRLAQQSPSLIPRKTSVATPTSARASPDNKYGHHGGGVSLSTKSSYASLNNSSGSTSRLPTAKPRNVHSSTAQYGDEEDTVPPVPAIPKAYESPKETDQQFFTNQLRSSQSGGISKNETSVPDFDNTQPTKLQKRDVEPPRKQSGESTRAHKRIDTIDDIERSANIATASRSYRQQLQSQDNNGRKNGNLQPLRLPPLNLMPIASQIRDRDVTQNGLGQDWQAQNTFDIAQTPEPRRIAKTPSTPMTASKATFFRRAHEDNAKQKPVRSSTSHFALRDLMQVDDNTTRFFDDTDTEFAGSGVPIPAPKQRSAITPFSSGSLPKGSSEFVRAHRARPSGDFSTGDFTLGKFHNFQVHDTVQQKPSGPRPSRSGTDASYKTAETPSSFESPTAETGSNDSKKENSSGGLRRKLSLGWRRSSSKGNNQLEHKSSPQDVFIADKEKPSTSKLQKRQSEMPPPKLPASATWTGDLPSVPASTSRPSLDSLRRKSTATSISTASNLSGNSKLNDIPSMPKTKSQHNEQPQPIPATHRSTSWTANGAKATSASKPTLAATVRKPAAAPALSAIHKDKDDLAADEEMRRLSQKRRDVDTAARESEELKKRAVARSPMTPERVLHDRNCSLNIFERGEIMDFEKEGIYFTGTKNARKIVGSLNPSPQLSSSDKEKTGNYGYDDERGDYNIVTGDHLAYRYEVVDVLGKGSFGQVVRCVDHKEGGIVAIKIIRNKKRFHQQALVEVSILGRLREWDPDGSHATLSITSSFYFRSHLCIVTPCLSINLYELIRAHNFVGFPLPLIRRFARQLLACLVLLQNKRIIHCDLKPENILLCEARKADCRVIDFGSSCKEEEKVYTYIQSRFYRSPEVILGSSYGLGIDMWSLGCILAELWTGYPLFPGENEQEQLACIMEIFGPPDRHLVERCTRKKLFFDSVGKPRLTVSSKGRRRRPSSKTLSQALKSEDEAFLDFITRCLRWDPDRRLKPQDAINHPFITNQPLNQRPGIPEEARRAARVRPAVAVPAASGTNGVSVSSPVKRVHTTTGVTSSTGNAFAQQQVTATPAKDRSRPLPETPQTAVRSGVSTMQPTLGSPSKRVQTSDHIRRASNVNGPAVGTKRASNGVHVNATTPAAATQQRMGSGTGANLAALAAREANTNAATRWRT
ncbi:Putative serine/threonine-protein kinase, active [Septoria linicola]|uniref:Serine/threonine-protein kinase, active n=1 Tax=Septoria linicola TaxID=215465 RepID=A0A9Q9AG07_9PEZI|nr:putative serine/threonine-protein kinase, active [Septoria linicola]USW46854.1 Putative serine/threonine-protein kinase, active [Septoria linicola]